MITEASKHTHTEAHHANALKAATHTSAATHKSAATHTTDKKHDTPVKAGTPGPKDVVKAAATKAH